MIRALKITGIFTAAVLATAAATVVVPILVALGRK